MKAVVYDAPRSFSYRETADPEPAADEALVRIHACGLCGTDLHIHEGEFEPRFPLIPGHEFTGEIARLAPTFRGSTRVSGLWPTATPSAEPAFIACAVIFSFVKIWEPTG